jgi:hypothetical protein
MPASRRTDVQPPLLDSWPVVNDLSAVADEVWAVGRDRFPGPALIMHSAGGEPWQLTSYSTSSEPVYTDLSGVHATTNGDVWAVGSERVQRTTLILHSDGTTWQPVESPHNADGQHLSAVAAWGRDDAFVVGSRFPPPSSPLVLAAWDTLAARWDGAQWAAVPGLGHGILSGVCAVGPGAYWAVGTTALSARAGHFPLVAHYANGQWHQVGPEVAGALHSVAATGPDDVWAVGSDQDPSHPPGPLILHHDGHTWAPTDVPVVGGYTWLNAVACAGRDNVWAVGGKQRTDGLNGPFILHFDGSAWAVVEPPATAVPGGELHAVIVLPSGEAWAAGKASPIFIASGYPVPLVMSTEGRH